ncbi:MAG: phospholipase D-like domain-containing protein [Propionibacterium sp.]|nr:phospholipase D-like domain-containing protein [Propionibacterium sp.]
MRIDGDVVRSVVKGVALGWAVAQTAALVTVHLVDRTRKARIPGGRHGFPTLPPADTPVDDNVVRSYTDGHSLFDDMLASIEGAHDHVYFETFIWRSDSYGKRFKETLIRAAERGVQVFAVYDGFGALNQDPRFKFFPHHPNLHVRRFPEIRSGMFTLNLRKTGRDHRKILVVDGEIGYVGGYNIGDRFADEWRDTHVEVRGPAVWELENGFIDFWNHFKRRHQPALPDTGAREWNAHVTAAFNLPSRLLFPVRGLYLDAMERATKRILITTAYFIPDQEILQGLIDAAHRGVQVRVLIPEYSNHILADWVARPYLGILLRNGIEIWLYQHAMVHSKTMTVDGMWSTVGTANIDRLSLQGNFEANMQFFSEPFAQRMEQIFDNDLTTARPLSLEEWSGRGLPTRLAEALLSPFRWIV